METNPIETCSKQTDTLCFRAVEPQTGVSLWYLRKGPHRTHIQGRRVESFKTCSVLEIQKRMKMILRAFLVCLFRSTRQLAISGTRPSHQSWNRFWPHKMTGRTFSRNCSLRFHHVRNCCSLAYSWNWNWQESHPDSCFRLFSDEKLQRN